MVKKYTILILAALTGINFNAKGIGTKGLALAAIGTGCITNGVLGKGGFNFNLKSADSHILKNLDLAHSCKGLDIGDTLAAGAGILAGVAVSAALIRRDCNNYRQLMHLSTNALDSIKQNKLVTDLVMPQEIKHTPYFAQLFLDRKLRKLYADKFPYYNAQNDLHNLSWHLQNTMQNIAQANHLLYGSPLLTPVKKAFLGAKHLDYLGEIRSLSYQAKSLNDDINFKSKLIDDYLKNANRNR